MQRMFKREHAMRETYDILTEAAKEREAKDKELTEKKMKEKEDFYEAMNRIRKQRELEEADYENFSNALYNNHLQTVIEAIYISALQEVTSLSDEAIQMAQKLVENYINEKGGARHIMESNVGKTYLLDFMFECAQTARDTDMVTFLEAEEAEKKEKDDEKEEAKKDEEEAKEEVEKDKEADSTDADENESGEDIKVGDADGDGKDDTEDVDKDDSDEEKKEESKEEEKDPVDDLDSEEEKSEEEVKEDEKEEEKEEEKAEEESPKEDSEDPVDDLDDSEEEKSEEPAEEAPAEDKAEEPAEDVTTDDGFGDADAQADAPDPGMEDVENSKDEDFDVKDSKADMFEKLENDDTVVSAVDIIAKRVADAEAEFIKKNAEDKQKIEAIADKIDERIKAVTDTDKTGEEKESEQEELKQEAAHDISNVRNDRIQCVFEYMVNINANAIVTDEVLKESYTLENGKLDFTKIEEATLVQYGFLEFLNTVQLENVNEEYIAKVLHQEV